MTRQSLVATFTNHPPIRLWAEFEKDETHYISDFEDGCVWNGNPQWGHHQIVYYICKSGKRIYWATYNSGQTYNGYEPRTKRCFLKDTEAIKQYFEEHDMRGEWNRVCGDIEPSLIVDSDLL